MPIKLGTDNTSEHQLHFLKRSRESSLDLRARFLQEILSIEEIWMGTETLHPDWVALYESVRDRIRKRLPTQTVERFERELAALSQSKEIATIDPETTRIAFLLGAGASKPTPSDIPTVKELLPDLLSRARRLNRVDLQKLADFCENSRIDNIEDLLTAAQLSEFCSRNSSVLRLVDFLIYRRQPDIEEGPYTRQRSTVWGDPSAIAFLQDTLQMLFGLLSSRMLPAQPNAGHKAIAEYVQTNPHSTIVTTNYDCCMDLALRSQNTNFSYRIDFSNKQTLPSAEENETALIKLHGSLNWFYCETCQEVHLIDIKRTVKEYLADEGCYSVVAVCKDCGGQRRGLLVPPLAMKFDLAPPLTPLIEEAQESFSRADVITVVGFSFADADMYISRMLTKAMQMNPKAKVIVFDPDPLVGQKLCRQLSLRIAKFDERRVIPVTGDCAITLPHFLQGKLCVREGGESVAEIESNSEMN